MSSAGRLSLSPSSINITAATGRSICLDTVHISNSLDQPLGSGRLRNNSSGRSESTHSELTLNVSDLGWVTSQRYVSPGGKILFAKGMFYYGPKIHSQLSFHLSRWKESCWLRQYSWLYCLTPSASTVRGNHSQMVPGEGRNVHQTDRERKNQQGSSGRGVMKYVCQHDMAWTELNCSVFPVQLMNS